jgi:hypothetical protein
MVIRSFAQIPYDQKSNAKKTASQRNESQSSAEHRWKYKLICHTQWSCAYGIRNYIDNHNCLRSIRKSRCIIVTNWVRITCLRWFVSSSFDLYATPCVFRLHASLVFLFWTCSCFLYIWQVMNLVFSIVAKQFVCVLLFVVLFSSDEIEFKWLKCTYLSCNQIH